MPKIKFPKQPHITVSKKKMDYDPNNDPFFIEKAERAAAFLAKHPLPEEFLRPSKKKKK